MRPLVLALLLVPASLWAQDLLPDPGFEKYETLPTKEGDLTLRYWKNPSRGGASPDYYHQLGTGRGSLNGYEGHTYSGEALPIDGMGLISLVGRLKEKEAGAYEYLYTKLRAPLVPGRRYRFQIQATLGKSDLFGCIAVDGWGISLGKAEPEQSGWNRVVVPDAQIVFVSTEPLGTTDWYTYAVEFVAETEAEYLMLGNFMARAEQKEFNIFRAACRNKGTALLFFDGASLVPTDDPDLLLALAEEEPEPVRKPEPKPEPTTDTVPETKPAPPADGLEAMRSKEAPRTFLGRTIVRQGDIAMPEGDIVLDVWDNLIVDGDTVSLQFNGEWLLENHMVSKKVVKIPIHIDPAKNNLLVLHAHNLGSMPPNTAEVAYTDAAGKRHILTIRSDMETSGAIRFTPEVGGE